MATIKALRRTLEPHFDFADTVLRRLVEAGLLPPGLSGRTGSAPITPRQGALALLACGCLAWSTAIDAPTAAQRLADFRFHSRNGRSDVTLLDCVAGELVSVASGAANSPGPGAWRIGEYYCLREGGGLRLQFLAADTPLNELFVLRQTRIGPQLIVAIAELFKPPVAELEARAAELREAEVALGLA